MVLWSSADKIKKLKITQIQMNHLLKLKDWYYFSHTFDKPPFDLITALNDCVGRSFMLKSSIYQTVKKWLIIFSLNLPPIKLSALMLSIKFSCACDLKLSYIDMSSRHVSSERASKFSWKQKNIFFCNICNSNKLYLNSFTILKKWNLEYETKIDEVLSVKKVALS